MSRIPTSVKHRYKGQHMLKCAELVEKIPPEALPSLSKAKEAQESQAKPEKEKQGTDAKPEPQSAGSHPAHDGGEK